MEVGGGTGDDRSTQDLKKSILPIKIFINQCVELSQFTFSLITYIY